MSIITRDTINRLKTGDLKDLTIVIENDNNVTNWDSIVHSPISGLTRKNLVGISIPNGEYTFNQFIKALSIAHNKKISHLYARNIFVKIHPFFKSRYKQQINDRQMLFKEQLKVLIAETRGLEQQMLIYDALDLKDKNMDKWLFNNNYVDSNWKNFDHDICFDNYSDEVEITNYLNQSRNNIVIVDETDSIAFCTNRVSVRSMDFSSSFYECKCNCDSDSDSDSDSESKEDYVITGKTYHNMMMTVDDNYYLVDNYEILNKGGQLFQFVKTNKTVDYIINKQKYERKHNTRYCKENTNGSVYRLIRFDWKPISIGYRQYASYYPESDSEDDIPEAGAGAGAGTR